MKRIYHSTKVVALFLIYLLATNQTQAQKIAEADIKKNVNSLETPLKKILLLQPKTFEFNTAGYKHLELATGKQFGFLAENVQSVFPTLVTDRHVKYMWGKNVYRDATIQQVDEKSLVPVLVAAMQELHLEISKLKAEIELLKKQS